MATGKTYDLMILAYPCLGVAQRPVTYLLGRQTGSQDNVFSYPSQTGLRKRYPVMEGRTGRQHFSHLASCTILCLEGKKLMHNCIGLATATGTPPDLSWTDSGKPITCTFNPESNNAINMPNSIDPAVFIDDDGSQHLVYGGGRIWMTDRRQLVEQK